MGARNLCLVRGLCNLLLWTFILLCCHINSEAKRNHDILNDSLLTNVTAAVGQKVTLPCSVSPPETSDRPILVLIYQGSIGTPVYSLDARGGSLSNGERWSDVGVLGSRAYFDLESPIPGLVVQPVKDMDESLYRCRVDFRLSPTRNSRIVLTVIVPPRNIAIGTGEGVEVANVLGPYVEGSSLTIHCSVVGGRPRPQLTWWKEADLLDADSEILENDFTVNTLNLPKLTRQHLHQNFTCQAQNSNISHALVKTVTLDMLFPIESVVISGYEDPIIEGTPRKLTCKAYGSRPVAEITWFLNGVEISGAFEKITDRGTTLKSSVIILPKMRDDGAEVVCRARNPSLRNSVMEDLRRISVYYPPRVKLVSGRGLVPDAVKEGDDFYFECEILANPKAQRTIWYYEGAELPHNVSAGVIHSNQSLVLQKVRRTMSGPYQCGASNAMGNSSSNNLLLKVKYAPICSHATPGVYGAEKGEQVNIPCQTHASPKAVAYTWAFNSSSELVDLTVLEGERRRHIPYTPKNDVQFGTLLCWATNEVGRQKIPCLYHIIHSSLPEPVSNCIFNISSSSATIDCDEGWNGGLDQTFTLQIIPNHSPATKQTRTDAKHTDSIVGGKGDPRALANTSVSPRPSFLLNGLKPGVKYLVRVSAVNKKGRSKSRNFSFMTPVDTTEKQIQGLKERGVSWTFIVSLFGGLILLGVVSTSTAFCVRRRLLASRRCNIITEVALERRRPFLDKEELVECLPTTVAGVDGLHRADTNSL